MPLFVGMLKMLFTFLKEKCFNAFLLIHYSGQIKLDKDGRDNPYADPVDFQTQYAVVQKNWETPAKLSNHANSSNPSNLVDNTDSFNIESPPETTNPKNSSSNEKTSGSTETSETIPKPPNV